MGNPTQKSASKLGSALYVPRPYSKSRHVLWVLFVFLATVLVFCFLDQKAFDYLERYTYNMRMAIRSARNYSAAQDARRKIVLVTLSDESFASGTLPSIPPLPRNYHAKVIRDLSRAGAKAIVFDLIFAGEKPHSDGCKNRPAQHTTGRDRVFPHFIFWQARRNVRIRALRAGLRRRCG